MNLEKVHDRRINNTPWDAPLVPCNCGHENEGEINSRMKPESNCLQNVMYNLEVAPNGENIQNSLHKKDCITFTHACVLHQNRTPLMPMKMGKAASLIKRQKAKIIKHFPFTIQLNYETTKQIQPITMGIDTGCSHIGFSITSIDNKKEYFNGTVEQEGKGNPTKDRLDEKRMYRRNRRSRLWHRELRFNNRKKKEGWIPPSIERKYITHKNLIKELIKK